MNSRYTFLSVLFIALASMFFIACERDGVYKPEKKLSKIYFEKYGLNGEQTWEWDGNLLKSITISYTYPYVKFAFEYQNQRLKTIICTDDRGSYQDITYYHFHYNGQLLSYIEGFQDTGNEEFPQRPCAKYTFTHNERKQISEIVFEDYGLATKAVSDPLTEIIPLILPGISLADAEKIIQTQSDSKSYEKSVITLDYDGDNVKNYRIVQGNTEYGCEFQYTIYPDPLYRFFSCNYTHYHWPFISGYSRNMPSTCTGYEKYTLWDDNHSFHHEYSYQLDKDGYVIAAQHIETYVGYGVHDNDSVPSVQTIMTEYRYEYLE